MPRRPRLAAVLVALIAALVLGWGIGDYALYEPDEARHAEVGREMLEAATWEERVTPRLDGAPYRNKPAPFYWLLAASYALFGIGEFGARIVSVVAGVATVAAVALWGARRWGPRTGVLAGVVLLTAPQFALLGRFSTADMTVTLWTTLGVLAVDRFARHAGTSLVPAAIAGGLGLLAKGAAAPVLIALVGLASLATQRRLALLGPRVVAIAALAFVAIVGPWHVAVAVLDPAYLRRLYLDQHWARAVDSLPRLHTRPALFYVPVLLGGFFPWSALLPATVRATLRAGRRDQATVFCALWAAIVLFVFSLAEGKSAAYILPAFPPLALLSARLVGLVLSGAADAAEITLARAGLWAAVAVCAIVPVAALVAGTRAYGGALLGPSLWTLLLLLPALAVGWLLRRGRPGHAMLALAAGAVAVLLILFQTAAPALMRVHSDEPLARALRAAAPDHAAAPLVGYHVRSASLRFYLGRPVLLRENPRQLRRLLERHPLVFVVTSPRHVPELTAAGPFVPWWVGPRRVLYASQPPPPALP